MTIDEVIVSSERVSSPEVEGMCAKAEFYFLAYMAQVVMADEQPDFLLGSVDGESLLMIEKRPKYVSEMGNRVVRFGVPSLLVLESENTDLDDAILISEDSGNTYKYGRKVGVFEPDQFGDGNTLQHNLRINEFFRYMNNQIEKAMNRCNIGTNDVNRYRILYEKLKKELVGKYEEYEKKVRPLDQKKRKRD